MPSVTGLVSNPASISPAIPRNPWLRSYYLQQARLVARREWKAFLNPYPNWIGLSRWLVDVGLVFGETVALPGSWQLSDRYLYVRGWTAMAMTMMMMVAATKEGLLSKWSAAAAAGDAVTAIWVPYREHGLSLAAALLWLKMGASFSNLSEWCCWAWRRTRRDKTGREKASGGCESIDFNLCIAIIGVLWKISCTEWFIDSNMHI